MQHTKQVSLRLRIDLLDKVGKHPDGGTLSQLLNKLLDAYARDGGSIERKQ